MMISPKKRNDYRKFYEFDLYMHFVPSLYLKETKKEADFVKQTLHMNQETEVLDIPCGVGRHANLLAPGVKSVVGVDNSSSFIEYACQQAKTLNLTNTTYLLEDIRQVQFKDRFDAVIVMFTSFGMFSHEENIKVLTNISKALKKGGQFAIDFLNPYILHEDYTRTLVSERGKDLMIDLLSMNKQNHRFQGRRIYLKDGKRTAAYMSHELFTLEQLQVLLPPLGLKIRDVYGSGSGKPFKAKETTRMFVIGQKKP